MKFTLNIPQFREFVRLASRKKPEFQGWRRLSSLAGWTTVQVPAYNGTMQRFYDSLGG